MSNRFIDSLRLQEMANYLLTNEHEDRDLTFIVEGQRISCHKLIVKNASDELREKFHTEWLNKTEIELDNCTHKVFFRLLQYIYTALFNYRGFNETDALCLLKISCQFGLTELYKDLCSNVKRRGFLNVWNVAQFLELSNEFHLQELRNYCIEFIDERAIELIQSQSLLELKTIDLLATILARDSFYVKEIEIFKLVRNWLEKHFDGELMIAEEMEEKRKNLLSTVRLNFIVESEFESVVKPTSLFSSDDYEVAVQQKMFSERINPY